MIRIPIVWPLSAAVFAWGCGSPPEPPAVEPAPAVVEPPAFEMPDPATLPDVLLITLDTTRADRLGSYGYDKALTDTLDQLAVSGRRYERAYSPLPLTIPSHATLFTGTYPPVHGIRSNSDRVLKPEAVTLAERLKEAGYRTGASVAAFVTTRRFGFDQGFDVYFDDVDIGRDQWHSERPADAVIADILSWDALKDPSTPRFAWVHLYDAHFPYLPWPDYIKKTENRPYDAELARIDDQVAALMEGFKDRPVVVVVVGDHGEGLGDHHEVAHGMQIYDSTQRVPWFMSGPGIAPEVVDTPVSLVDVAPTLLDLLGLPPLSESQGAPTHKGGSGPIYMESYEVAGRFGLAPSVGVVDGPLKLIALPKPELYDLVADPGESTNLADQRPDDVIRLRKQLDAWGFEPPSNDASGADSDLAAKLASLGYTASTSDFDPNAVLPDPKDHVELLRKSQMADRASLQKKFDEQRKLLEELVEEYPDIVEFRSRLIQALVRAQDLPAAANVAAEAVERFPEDGRLLADQGTILVAEQKFSAATDAFQRAAKLQPKTPRLRVAAVQSLYQSGDPAAAYDLAQRYLDEFPNDFNLAGWLGVEMVKLGRFEPAVRWLELGILADTPERDVAYNLGAAATGRNDREGGIRLLELECRNHPTNLPALSSLGKLLLVGGNHQRALDVVEGALVRMPKAQALWLIKAQALFNLQRFADARVALDAGLAANDPPLADLLMLNANLLKQEGQLDKATLAFQAALARRKVEEAGSAPPKPGGQPK